jgi:hypothetical protein
MRRIVVETINEEAASRSPYLAALRRNFDVSKGHRKVTLYRKGGHDSPEPSSRGGLVDEA